MYLMVTDKKETNKKTTHKPQPQVSYIIKKALKR